MNKGTLFWCVTSRTGHTAWLGWYGARAGTGLEGRGPKPDPSPTGPGLTSLAGPEPEPLAGTVHGYGLSVHIAPAHRLIQIGLSQVVSLMSLSQSRCLSIPLGASLIFSNPRVLSFRVFLVECLVLRVRARSGPILARLQAIPGDGLSPDQINIEPNHFQERAPSISSRIPRI